MPRIFDASALCAQGALVTASDMVNKSTVSYPGVAGTQGAAIFLRWQINPRVGMPLEPFKVWRRPAIPLGEEFKIGTSIIALPPLGHVLMFDEPVVSFSATVQSEGAAKTVVVLPVADGVGLGSVLGALSYNLQPNGWRSFTFQAPYITGVLLLNTNTLHKVTAIKVSEAETIAGWELVETVGLPVDGAQWHDLPGQSHGIKQGLVGAPLPAKEAAVDRYVRGVNPFGWQPVFPTGETAPVWELPGAAGLIKEAEADLLPMLHEAMALPAHLQGAFTRDFVVHPPENAAGKRMDVEDGSARVNPLTLLQMAVSTDPLQAVTLGFGTGYAYEDLPTLAISDNYVFFGDENVSDWDYMVTGRWASDKKDQGKEVEYAALIPRPRRVMPAPAPADLQLDFLGHHQPAAADQPWTAAARLSWERSVLDNLSKVASFAVGRADLATANPAAALMQSHFVAAGHMPIGDARHPKDPETTRQSATDSAFAIPNNPGLVNARYAVATQNIFGIWSPWVTVPFQSAQPEPDLVQIVAAHLVPVDPGPPATVCPASLQIDFVLDWRVRRVQIVQFRGRLFAAANRHQPPPGGFPAGLQKSLAGPASALTVTFSGDTPSVAGGDIICLDAQGEKAVAPGSGSQGESRRYRLRIGGFELDYAATPHIGLALQGQLTERLLPSRNGAWTPQPKVAYASDPRARATGVIPIVPLASLPDANGECHARIHWAVAPAAEGYAVYTSSEFTLLTRTGQSHPEAEAILSERLIALKAAFNSNSDRNAFTRVNSTLLKANSLDVTLPRGSQAIHCWAVIPVSAGGIEGPWPSGPAAADQLMVYAAPKVAEPAPPRIEVRRVSTGTGFAAAVRVETRGTSGAYPRRICLYRTRVADAARRLNSMGFPIAEIAASGGGWSVVPPSPAPEEWIESVSGTDQPGGSWRYVWYRAVAWADPIPERGVLGGRSQASPAVPIIIPPDGPPALGVLAPSWPGGGIGDVQLDFASSAPVAPTPLGPHVLHVHVVERGIKEPLIASALPLADLPTSAPGGAASGLWRDSDTGYRLLIRRTHAANPASVTVRMVDPLGRSSERNLSIGEGSIVPVPVLSGIQSFTISGRGEVFTFTIDNASDEVVGGEYYRLALTLTLRRAPSDADPALPWLGASPPRTHGGTQFTRHGDKLTYSARLKDIPTTAPTETIAVSRQRIGGRVTVSLFVRADLRSVEARVISPDGTTIIRTSRG